MAAKVGNRVDRRTMGRLRLVSQRLVPLPAVSPGPASDVCGSIAGTVRWMTAMQAQDLQAAIWAVGARVPGAGLSDVRSALDSGAVVRSWPMRGTLHLVAPEDLHWMLALTAERLTKSIAARHRELGITWADIEKCRDLALERVAGGRGCQPGRALPGVRRRGAAHHWPAGHPHPGHLMPARVAGAGASGREPAADGGL